jgi:hypothetical protein
MVWAICATKSASVQVAPTEGDTIVTRGNVQIGNEGLGAMSDVLKFSLFHLSRPERFGGRSALERLNTGHFVGAQNRFPSLRRTDCPRIDFTHGFRLLLENQRVFLGGIEPISAQMGFNRRLVLKNARLVGARCFSRCHV